VSILLVEQNARAALQVADTGYVLETGEVVLSGRAPICPQPAVAQSYLGQMRVDAAADPPLMPEPCAGPGGL
jgi:ABC-type lipopolysaccharide export system ATPase subunit